VWFLLEILSLFVEPSFFVGDAAEGIWKLRQRKRAKRDLQDLHPEYFSEGDWFEVVYCPEDRFGRRFSQRPRCARGGLFLRPDKIIFWTWVQLTVVSKLVIAAEGATVCRDFMREPNTIGGPIG
jgi:hypothetical protein